MNHDIILSRQQIGQWISYLAGVTLLFGILGWIWQGGFTPVVIGALAIGIVALLLWVLIAPHDFMNFVSGRQLRFSTGAVFSTLLLIGIVSLVYIFLARSALTLDMTEGRHFTLSRETLDVLATLDRPIRITGFYDATAVQQREVDDQFFRLYEDATDGLITRNYVDPGREPALAQRFGVLQNGDVFLSYLKEDGSIDFGSLMRVARQEGGQQEREMTQAILRLNVSGSLKVYFETGHDELDPLDDSQQGLSGIHLGMQANEIVTDSLNLIELLQASQQIPDDASAIIMARPTTALLPDEVTLLDNYLKRGGGLFIMADALFNDGAFLSGETPFNHYLWDNFGLSALNAVIVDYASSSRTPLDIIGYQVFTNSAIGARLDPAQNHTLFRIARAINISGDPPVTNGTVIVSSPNSYGETNFQALTESNEYAPDEGEDIPGPLASVGWGWNQDTGGRVLLVGDSDFITNGFVRDPSNLGNAILFSDGMSWLTGMSEQVNFSPQAFTTAQPLIFVSGQMLDAIALVTVFLMPGVVLAAGVFVWFRRARR